MEEFVTKVQTVKTIVRTLDDLQGYLEDYPEYEPLRDGTTALMRQFESVLESLVAEYRVAGDRLRIH